MNSQKYIIIDVTNEENLTKGIQELANSYGNTGFTDQVKIYKLLSKENHVIITFEPQTDFERFQYFVNYLHYPATGKIGEKVRGYWITGSGDQVPEALMQKRVMLFISENDTEYDNVFAAFEGVTDNYKLGFSSRESFVNLGPTELTFEELDFAQSDLTLNQTITPDPEEVAKHSEKKGTGCLFSIGFLIFIFSLGMFLMT